MKITRSLNLFFGGYVRRFRNSDFARVLPIFLLVFISTPLIFFLLLYFQLYFSGSFAGQPLKISVINLAKASLSCLPGYLVAFTTIFIVLYIYYFLLNPFIWALVHRLIKICNYIRKNEPLLPLRLIIDFYIATHFGLWCLLFFIVVDLTFARN